MIIKKEVFIVFVLLLEKAAKGEMEVIKSKDETVFWNNKRNLLD